MVPNSTRAILAAVAVIIALTAASCDISSPLETDSLNTSDATASWFSVSPSQIDLTSNDSIASIRMANHSRSSVPYTARDNASWITLNRRSGEVPGDAIQRVRVETSRAGLTPGTYSGVVAIDAGPAGTARVRVTMTVQSQTVSQLAISPLEVDLGATDTTEVIRLKNETNSAIEWRASESAGWLTLGSTSGSVPAQRGRGFRLYGHRAGLASGTYRTSVTITTGSSTTTVPVSMTVQQSQAELDASPLQVDFGTSDTTELVALTNTGDTAVTWSASESSGWLSLNATSGTLAADSKKGLRLFAERDGMAPGSYSARVTISAGTVGEETVTVSMTVPTGSSSSVALAGRVVDQFNGNGRSGITVEFGDLTATTDGTGRFTIPGSPSSTLRSLTLSGSGMYRRGTFARSGDDQWRVVPSNFNMNGFNDMAREVSPGTIRWATAPEIYIDARPEGFSGGPEFDLWLSEVRNHAAVFFSKWTGHQMSAASVRVGNSPPADFTPGTIVVHFSEKDSRYSGISSVVGRAYTSRRSDNSISGATIWLRFGISGGESGALFRQAVFAHELGHAMGISHMNGSISSLMTTQVSVTDLTGFDSQVGSLLYSRSPGNTAHDNDSAGSYRGALVPSAAASPEEWVCGVAPDLLPGGRRATAP